MKKIVLILSIVFAFYTAKSISPFIKMGNFLTGQNELSEKLIQALNSSGFDVIGQYNPGKLDYLKVIAFTSNVLKATTFGMDNRAALASVIKVGLITKNGSTQLFLQNPEYMFYAYLQDNMDNPSVKNKMMAFDKKVKDVLKPIGNQFTAYGGDLEYKKLKKYKYMFGMQDFNDPVELNSFNSFEEGVKTIEQSLAAGKNNTAKVYSLVDMDSKTAVFGVALLDEEDGESHFLKIIGEDHLAAMPYEIILQGTEASMLHGRFRFALYWPELTMGTFTKIMSTPGNVKNFLKALTE